MIFRRRALRPWSGAVDESLAHVVPRRRQQIRVEAAARRIACALAEIAEELRNAR
jgi:hypothetical protein